MAGLREILGAAGLALSVAGAAERASADPAGPERAAEARPSNEHLRTVEKAIGFLEGAIRDLDAMAAAIEEELAQAPSPGMEQALERLTAQRTAFEAQLAEAMVLRRRLRSQDPGPDG